jgi:hypothetical protein
MLFRAAAIALCAFASSSNALVVAQAAVSAQPVRRTSNPTCVEQATAMPAASTTNVAQTLVNLHDEKQVFNFCGGMMFQLVLSDALRSHLADVAKNGGDVTLYDASKARMASIPDYSKSAFADNMKLFHGREVRKVPTASGGMGFVLQLSLADGDDPEGWTPQEIAGYDGWGHDVSRVWRTGEMLESEGYKSFQSTFGPSAFTLHHRFYLHLDRSNGLWLSAEDGCEGVAPMRLK